jgi:GT2 family glycosyltransferase
MSISVVTPVWNGRPLLERLFDSLDAQTERPLEILAVDNGSTDGAAEYAQSRGARLIPMGRNAGFAPAMNRGIRESRGEWVAALNTDVELDANYLAALRAAAERENAWFATGKLLSASDPGRLDGAFDLLSRGGAAWRAGNGMADGPLFSTPRRIWSAPWTAALFSARLFERVGLLEESYESYMEDVDFGLRCAQLGCDGVYEPAATARHVGSAALGKWSPEMARLIARNQTWLVARRYPRPLPFSYLRSVFVAQALWGALALRHGAGLAWLRGKWQGLRGFAAQNASSRTFREVDTWLRENECAIFELQAQAGFDFYWRMYFLLTGVRQSDTWRKSES